MLDTFSYSERTKAQKIPSFVFFALIISFFCYDFSMGMVVTEDNLHEKTIIVQKDDNQKEIALQTGDVIQIELRGTGGTGFRWYIDNLDTQHLKLLSEEMSCSSEGKTGTPLSGVWRFKVIEKGYTEIKMDFYRIWEGKEKSEDHFFIKIHVH